MNNMAERELGPPLKLRRGWNLSSRKVFTGLTCLFIVYICWGCTYLAIRIAVRPDGGLPPFLMSGFRLLLGGVGIFTIARIFRQPWRTPLPELAKTALLGIFLWTCSNGALVWSEKYVDSGYAALLAGGTVPVWGALFEAIRARRLPSLLLVISLLIGLGGMALLSSTSLYDAEIRDWWAFFALIGVGVIWALGAIFQQRLTITCSPLVHASWQQFAGGLGYLALSFCVGETWTEPDHYAIGAWFFLVIFGSIVSFSCYVMSMRLLPLSVATTYAYVNPVVAVIAGHFILDEQIDAAMIGGMILVAISIYGVFRDRFIRARREAVSALAEETAAG